MVQIIDSHKVTYGKVAFFYLSKTYFNFIHTFSLKLKKQNMKNWKDKIIGILSALIFGLMFNRTKMKGKPTESPLALIN